MAELTLDGMVERLKVTLDRNLVSVVLYGSAAAGDHAGKKSDYNLLVVTHALEVRDLTALSALSNRWMKQGNPPPLLFTLERFRSSADVFPIEIADIQDNHKVLWGSDPLENMPFSYDNFRLELEHELKGKLIQLRERFLATEGKPKLVAELMVQSLSTFLVLFKNALRLYGEKPALKKLEALAQLEKHLPLDAEVFRIIEGLKEGKKSDLDRIVLFERYLKAVEKVVDGVDRHMHRPKGA
jgi:hypothetical protein